MKIPSVISLSSGDKLYAFIRGLYITRRLPNFSTNKCVQFSKNALTKVLYCLYCDSLIHAHAKIQMNSYTNLVALTILKVLLKNHFKSSSLSNFMKLTITLLNPSPLKLTVHKQIEYSKIKVHKHSNSFRSNIFILFSTMIFHLNGLLN